MDGSPSKFHVITYFGCVTHVKGWTFAFRDWLTWCCVRTGTREWDWVESGVLEDQRNELIKRRTPTTVPFICLAIHKYYNIISLVRTTMHPRTTSIVKSSLKRSFQRPQKRRVATENSILVSTRSSAAALSTFRTFSSSNTTESSPFAKTKNTSATPTTAAHAKLRKFVPRKAAVQLTESARTFFQTLLQNPPRPEIIGILLSYQQAEEQVKMMYHFQFITKVPDMAEGVSLEVLEDGTPKPPDQSQNDGLPKLYLHPDAFFESIGCDDWCGSRHSWHYIAGSWGESAGSGLLKSGWL